MKLVIGSDHGGYELKQKLIEYIKTKNIEIIDVGTNSENSVDYPEFGAKVGKTIIKGDADRGIVICGSGIGISIAANKIKGIRATLCYDNETAKLSREHNNSNVLALGGRKTNFEKAKEMVDIWLNTEFAGGRHQNRIDLITKIEEEENE